jgi:helix-turn-helix protein
MMKLPMPIVSRIHELVLFSFLNDKNAKVKEIFEQMVKTRYTKICMQSYFPLFKNKKQDAVD